MVDHRWSYTAEKTLHARDFEGVTLKQKYAKGLDILLFSKQSYFRVISLKVGVTLPKGLWSTEVFGESSLATLK